MDENFLIQITNNLYRLTLFFPKKDPLRYKMREVASNILANRNNHITKELLINDLKTLNGFFEVAKVQQWVSCSDILVVQTQYINLLEKLAEKQECNITKKPPEILLPVQAPALPRPNTGRQKKILNFLKEKGRVQVQDVQQIFPEITKRTLRRDFEQMLKQGVVRRIGKRNNTCYQLTINTGIKIGHI